MRENRAAFARRRIVPRMLRGAAQPDASVELFGRRLDSPFLLAPVGVLELAHRDADLAVARAAARRGVPMIFSNQASRPMEECAAALGDSPRWFQLYWSTSDDLVESLVARAEACGCEAIVVTLDTTILGWRPRDLEPAFLPFLRGQGIAQYTSDPVFRRLMAEGSAQRRQPDAAADPAGAAHARCSSRAPIPARSSKNLSRGRARAAVQRFTEIFSRPSLSLGRPAVPARAHAAADPAQGHPAPRRRPPRARGRRRRHRGLQPRRPPGRRRDRDARRAARRGRGGRTAGSRCCSTPACAAAPTRSRRSRSARPPC